MSLDNIREAIGADLHDAIVALRDTQEGNVTLTQAQAGAILEYVFVSSEKMIRIGQAGVVIDEALEDIYQATRFPGEAGE